MLSRRIPFNDLQVALFARLNTDLSTDVYDYPQSGQAYPYIEIGAFTAAEDNTSTASLHSVTATINTYSSERGLKEVNDIMNAIVVSLTTGELSLANNWSVAYMGNELAEVFPEIGSEGIVQHGVLRPRWEILDES